MPLALPALKSALQSLFDAPPPDAAGCAQGWANAMQTYAAGVVPASATVTAAAATLSTALASAFEAPPAAASMESAFSAFALTVGGGMAGFVATPPPAPVGFAVQFSGPKPATHADAASAIGDRIHTWMSSGIGTLIAPPFTPTPWS